MGLGKAPEVNPLPRDKVLGAANETKVPESDSDQDIRYGLRWDEGLFDSSPIWTVVPDIEIINEICKNFAAEHLAPRKPTDVQVDPIAQGAFNKIFSVRVKIRTPSTPKEQADTGYTCHTEEYLYVFRVSLPVNPRFKTMSEYATLAYLRKNSTIPVALVLTFNASNHKENPLRFEWMLQTFMPGKPLEEMWHHLSDTGRQHIVRQLAGFQAEIFHMRHDGIGSLYATDLPESDSETKCQSFSVRTIATIPFYMRDRVDIKKANRGPFRSSREWLRAQLGLIQLECDRCLEQITVRKQYNTDGHQDSEAPVETLNLTIHSDRLVEDYHIINRKDSDEEQGREDKRGEDEDDEDNSEDSLDSIQDTSDLVQRLLLILPNFIPDTDKSLVEQSILFHQDLSMRNILVDKEGTVTAILDWENTACLPAWAACDIPSFIKKKSWYSLPNPNDYTRGENEDLYKARLLLYQLTGLRKVFLSYMKVICPSWIEINENSWVQRDFRRAVELCDYGRAMNSINHWLDTLAGNGFFVNGDNYVPLNL